MNQYTDVIIVGAGLSGICAAHYLQTKCPQKSYKVLEMRSSIGGTWDLFKYPGIRSDSDIYTFGYSFRPWKHPEAIAQGEDILQYIKDTAKDEGIEENIKYNHKVKSASWSSEQKQWTLEVENDNQTLTYTCNFILACSGYYNYDNGYTPDFQGFKDFKGKIIHPQLWDNNLDYTDKKVIVIGSGATAITLIPNIAEKAKEVIMLQRSPSYVVSKPSKDSVANIFKKILPSKFAHKLSRRKNILLDMFFFKMAQGMPNFTKKMIKKAVKKELGKDFDVEKHFSPKYNPWDQRVCLVPDNDFFDTVKSGKAKIVTDKIQSFTKEGISLESGEELKGDIIVTATGLEIKFLSNIKVTIDGKAVDVTKNYVYRGMMISEVPNLALITGYTNASWTLRAELGSQYVCRLLNYMDKKNVKQCMPHLTEKFDEINPLFNLSSGYFLRDADKLPKQGDKKPWKYTHNYISDLFNLRYSKMNDGVMKFE